MKKAVFYSELAYVFGMILLAFGTALTAYGGFGISMVVAPAFVLHLNMIEKFPFFTFAVGEYVLQGTVLLIMMVILRRVKLTYFLSFLTAVLYGLVLTASQWITALFPDIFALKLSLYVVGVLICTAGVSLFFHTYFSPAAYEMFVKEISRKFHKPLPTFKVVYDCASLAVALIMALIFRNIEGIGIGTVICAFVFGPLINVFSKLFDKLFTFQDALPLRPKFED